MTYFVCFDFLLLFFCFIICTFRIKQNYFCFSGKTVKKTLMGLRNHNSNKSVKDLKAVASVAETAVLEDPRETSSSSSSGAIANLQQQMTIMVSTSTPNKTVAAAGDVSRWAQSFTALLASVEGRAHFRRFLAGEHSTENLDFWAAVQDLHQMTSSTGTNDREEMRTRASHLFRLYIANGAEREVF
jgi:hypothetical protein